MEEDEFVGLLQIKNTLLGKSSVINNTLLHVIDVCPGLSKSMWFKLPFIYFMT